MPYGLVLGAAFAAAAFGAVAASGQSLAGGGFVRGGERGRDSVPTILSPGEYVSSTSEVAGFVKFATRLLGDQRGRELAGVAGMGQGQARAETGGGRGGDVVINNAIWYPDTVAKLRMTRDQAGAVRQLQARGMY
jgi:hypothetical protein